MLGHEMGVNKFKIQIRLSIFPDNDMKLETNNKRKTQKITDMQELNDTLPNKWIKEKWKGKLKNILKQTKMETQHTKTYGIQQEQF